MGLSFDLALISVSRPWTYLLIFAIVFLLIAFRFRQSFSWPWWIPIGMGALLMALPGLAIWHETFIHSPLYWRWIQPESIFLMLAGAAFAATSAVLLLKTKSTLAIIMLLAASLMVLAGIHDIHSTHLKWRLEWMGVHHWWSTAYYEFLLIIILLAFLPHLLGLRKRVAT